MDLLFLAIGLVFLQFFILLVGFMEVLQLLRPICLATPLGFLAGLALANAVP